ncbi:MAG TPA: hypothetical protein VG389_03890 [Myxococcota bacterium]|jgi:hypothetical protein|nr:hypothetical protein [Myxococcota bacterium]
MSIAFLRDRLHDGAAPVSRGRVKVDAARALQKLRDYRLADPHHYVLEILRAAVASGARVVRIRTDADDVELSFDGAPFPADVLRDLFAHALGGGADRDAVRHRLLALGVNGALALGPSFVVVQSSGATLRVTPRGALELDAEAGPPPDGAATRVHVHARVGWSVLRRAVAGAPEARAARERALHLPAELWVDGERVDRTVDFGPHVLARRELRAGTRQVVAAVPAQRLDASTLAIDYLGVTVTTRSLDLPALQIQAWARDDALARDASGADVIDDDPAFRRLQGDVGALAEELLEELAVRPPEGRAAVVRALLLPVALAAADPRPGQRRLLPARVQARLDQVALLPGPAGEWVSVAALRAEVAAGRPIRVAKRRWPRELYTPPVVLLAADEGPPDAWWLLPEGPRLDVREEIDARARRLENRQRFEAQPVEPARLPAGPYAARADVAAEGVAGEVGFASDTSGALVRFLLGGRLLAQHYVFELLPLRVRAVVDASGLEPDDAWAGPARGPARDAAIEAVLAAAEGALVGALAAAAAAGAALSDALRGHARDLAAALGRRARTLPPALERAPAWELAGGGFASLEDLRQRPECRYTTGPWPQAALDTVPVVVLRDVHREAVRGYFPGQVLVDHGESLQREVDVRRRLRCREPSVVTETVLAKVQLAEADVHGEVGLRPHGARELTLTLFRDGIRLGTRTIPALYGPTVAMADAIALTPTPAWDGAVPDHGYQRVVAVVADAQRRLLGPLLQEMAPRLLASMPPGAHDYLVEFMRSELAGQPSPAAARDELQQLAWRAPVFEGARGALTLAEIHEAAQRDGQLWTLEAHESFSVVPASMTVVRASWHVLELLAGLTGFACTDAGPEMERARQREAFAAMTPAVPVLPPIVPLRAAVESAAFRGELGWANDEEARRAAPPRGQASVAVEVLLRGRPYCTAAYAAPVPLRAIVDTDDAALDPAVLKLTAPMDVLLQHAVDVAVGGLVAEAARDPTRPAARAFILAMLAAEPDRSDAALTAAPVFPTTVGGAVAAADLGTRQRVCYTDDPAAAPLASGEPVVVANDVLVRRALGRFGERCADVTKQLRREQQALAARERLAPVEEVRVALPALLRRALRTGPASKDEPVEGEVALVGGHAPARLALLQKRRALCSLDATWPPGVAAAVNCDRLSPMLDGDDEGVAHDAVYKRVVALVEREVEALAADTARDWDEMEEATRAALTPTLARLGAWILGRGGTAHPALRLPVLRATDGRALSWAELLAHQAAHGAVPFATRDGALLAPDAWVWQPRFGEREWLAAASLAWSDATAALAHADVVRGRPRVAMLAVPGRGRWREPVSGTVRASAPGGAPGQTQEFPIEGEIVLDAAAGQRLLVEVFLHRRLLETVRLRSAVPARARVNCDGLTPDETWQRAVRDDTYWTVRAALVRATERLLARLLREGSPPEWRPFVVAAARWRLRSAGPLAEALAAAPLFRALGGEVVSLGRAMAAAAAPGGVPVVDQGLDHAAAPGLLAALRDGTAAPDDAMAVLLRERLVLDVADADRAVLVALRVPFQDVTEPLRAALDRTWRRQARRIAELRWPGAALVRHAVDAGGWRGELALPDPPQAGAGVVLARAGVGVDEYRFESLGVAGALEHAGLPVDVEWQQALLREQHRRDLRDQLDALFADLAVEGPRHEGAQAAVAADYALRYLGFVGVRAAQHLDRVAGTAEALARAKIFVTADGRRVDLRAVADRVLRRGAVGVVAVRLDAGEVGGDVVLYTRSPHEPWIGRLGEVLGVQCVARLDGASAWRRWAVDADPERDTPLGEGMALLRREARLLFADAMGRLGAAELREVRVRRGKGRAPVAYDARRQIAYVDVGHAGARAALEEARTRPGRLYALLASIYGAINRALDRVTDDDEARTCGALLAHLGANPQLLDPRPAAAAAPGAPPAEGAG